MAWYDTVNHFFDPITNWDPETWWDKVTNNPSAQTSRENYYNNLPPDQRAKLATDAINFVKPSNDTWGVELIQMLSGDYAGYLSWQNNTVDVPVLLLGDAQGSVIRATPDGNVRQGSPITVEQMIRRIQKEKGSKEGGILKLKQQLAALNYYSGSREAQSSISFGDVWDNSLTNAIVIALWTASATNYSAAQKDPKRKSFISFDDFLNQGKKNPGLFGGSGSYGGGSSSNTRTSVVKQKFDAADYDVAVDELFQKTVGRGASKEELDYFIKQLQDYADANPQTTVTKTVGDTSTSTTTGGLNNERAASMLREQAVNTPGAEQYNKATKYLDYFMNALESPIKLG